MWLDKFIFTQGPTAPGGPFASRPSPGTVGNLYYADEGGVWRDDGTQWRPMLGNVQGYQPPLAANFTAINQGASSLVDSFGALLITGAAGDAGTILRGFHVALDGTTTDKIECAIAQVHDEHTGIAYPTVGLFFLEANTGKMVSVAHRLQDNGDGGLEHVAVFATWTNTTTPTETTFALALDGNGPTFLRLRRNPLVGNVVADYSRDRQTWVIIGAAAGAFTTAPDRGGLFASSFNTVAVGLVNHFRSWH